MTGHTDADADGGGGGGGSWPVGVRSPRRWRRWPGQEPVTGMSPERVEAMARAWAYGYPGVQAGVDLLFTDGYWPARTDFVHLCLYRPTWPWTGGQPLIVVDFDDAIDALTAHLLPCHPAEAGLLRAAARHAGVDTTTRHGPARTPGTTRAARITSGLDPARLTRHHQNTRRHHR